MTVIAAISDGRTVWMGADTHGECGGSLIPNIKIYRGQVERRRDGWVPDRRDYLFGVAGQHLLLKVMARHVKIETAPAPEKDGSFNSAKLDDWAQAVAEAWTSAALDLPDPPVGHRGRDERTLDGAGLFAFAGRIWYFSSNDATPAERGWDACGAGDDLATGAFHVLTRPGPIVDHQQILELALDAAGAWSAYCRPPFQVEQLDWPIGRLE